MATGRGSLGGDAAVCCYDVNSISYHAAISACEMGRQGQ